MATDLPVWFMEKYSKSEPAAVEAEAPAKAAGPSLYRQFLSLEAADTHQEREQIHGRAREAARERTPPGLLKKMAARYAKPEPLFEQDTQNILFEQGKKDIGVDTGPIVEAAEEAVAGPLEFMTAPVTAPIPAQDKGTRVFTDQTKLEEAISEVPDEGRVVTFKSAFKAARRAGKREFEHNGNLFNTRKSGETDAQWEAGILERTAPPPEAVDREAIRSQLRADAYKQSLLPGDFQQKELAVRPEATDPEFSDFMKRTGVSVAAGKSVDTGEIARELGPALDKIAPAFKSAGITPEITSGRRDSGNWSLHEVGEAVDLRLKNADEAAIETLEDSLPGSPSRVKIHGEKGRMWTDGTYEYIIHGKGDNVHLHVERETEESKERLVQHLIEKGKTGSVSQRGLSRYPDLLKKYGSKLSKGN